MLFEYMMYCLLYIDFPHWWNMCFIEILKCYDLGLVARLTYQTGWRRVASSTSVRHLSRKKIIEIVKQRRQQLTRNNIPPKKISNKTPEGADELRFQRNDETPFFCGGEGSNLVSPNQVGGKESDWWFTQLDWVIDRWNHWSNGRNDSKINKKKIGFFRRCMSSFIESLESKILGFVWGTLSLMGFDTCLFCQNLHQIFRDLLICLGSTTEWHSARTAGMVCRGSDSFLCVCVCFARPLTDIASIISIHVYIIYILDYRVIIA